MFRSLFRAILILGGGVATGIAVYRLLDGIEEEAEAKPQAPQRLEVDADAVPPDEKEALLTELEAQL